VRVFAAANLVGGEDRDDAQRLFLLLGMSHSNDTLRSARLLFSDELSSGAVGDEDLCHPAVREAVTPRPFATRPRAMLERAAMKAGHRSYERNCLEPLLAARRALLGSAAAGPPRFLVRVDEFPHAAAYDSRGRYGTDQFRRFHSIMSDAGVPFLLSVSPRVSESYLDPQAIASRGLDPGEADMLVRLRDEGVVMALHGCDHSTRRRSPRRRSEIGGLDPRALADLLDRAVAPLADLGLRLPVFVPPFNRFDASQYPLLAERFDVVAGGPESAAVVGFHRTPQWRGGAVYLPAYPPFYGRASAILPAVDRLAQLQPGVFVPVVIHFGWEADDGWEALEKLASAIAPLATPWHDFFASVRAAC
jgi:hypothetical protein